jgi:hypothetical protein
MATLRFMLMRLSWRLDPAKRPAKIIQFSFIRELLAFSDFN